MVDIKNVLKKKKDNLTKLEFQHFIAEFEEFREGMIKKNFRLEQEVDKMKDFLNDLQDDLKEGGSIKRKKRL